MLFDTQKLKTNGQIEEVSRWKCLFPTMGLSITMMGHGVHVWEFSFPMFGKFNVFKTRNVQCFHVGTYNVTQNGNMCSHEGKQVLKWELTMPKLETCILNVFMDVVQVPCKHHIGTMSLPYRHGSHKCEPHHVPPTNVPTPKRLDSPQSVCAPTLHP